MPDRIKIPRLEIGDPSEVEREPEIRFWVSVNGPHGLALMAKHSEDREYQFVATVEVRDGKIGLRLSALHQPNLCEALGIAQGETIRVRKAG